MTREPLAILMTIGILLSAVIVVLFARLADVDLDVALTLAGVMSVGVGGTSVIARSKVTPVEDPRTSR